MTQPAISMITTGRSHLKPPPTEHEKWRVRKARKLREFYGITLEEWEALMEKADYSCEICGKHVDDLTHLHRCTGKPFLCIDHDHSTGEIRGVLCPGCNSMLGLAGDDIEVLQKAIEYLTTHGKAY